jgi:hypothetical protein
MLYNSRKSDQLLGWMILSDSRPQKIRKILTNLCRQNTGFAFAFWVSFCLNIQGYNGSSESTSYRLALIS